VNSHVFIPMKSLVVLKIVLYQGTASAVPRRTHNFVGFSPCPAAAKAVFFSGGPIGMTEVMP